MGGWVVWWIDGWVNKWMGGWMSEEMCSFFSTCYSEDGVEVWKHPEGHILGSPVPKPTF